MNTQRRKSIHRHLPKKGEIILTLNLYDADEPSKSERGTDSILQAAKAELTEISLQGGEVDEKALQKIVDRIHAARISQIEDEAE